MALGLPGRPAPLVAGRHCRACGCRQLPARVSGAACGGLGKPLRAGQRVAPVWSGRVDSPPRGAAGVSSWHTSSLCLLSPSALCLKRGDARRSCTLE